MFHRGLLKTYDSESKIGMIYLTDSQLELHFSAEDFPNPSIPPQIGERVKCFINDDDTAKDKAKFIVRLDHKNSRTEKPLNRIFYSEEEDLNAIKEKERIAAQEALALEKWQKTVEEEVRTRVDLEVAQAKKELLAQMSATFPESNNSITSEADVLRAEQNHQLDISDQGIPILMAESALDHDQNLAEEQIEARSNLLAEQMPTMQDAVVIAGQDAKEDRVAVLNEADQVHPEAHFVLQKEDVVSSQGFNGSEELKIETDSHSTTQQELKEFSQDTQLDHTSSHVDGLPQIDDVLVIPSNSAESVDQLNVIDTKDQLPEFSFSEALDDAATLMVSNLDKKLETNASELEKTSQINAEQINQTQINQPQTSTSQINTALNIPETPKLSEWLEQNNTDLEPHSQSTQIQSSLTSIQQPETTSFNSVAVDSNAPGFIANQQPTATVTASSIQTDMAYDQASTLTPLNKVKTKLEYQSRKQLKVKRKSEKQINPLVIGLMISVLILIGFAYFAFEKYQERKQENEEKAKLYLLEQQRLIEEQRLHLGKLPNKKVLSEKSLDELLGKDREK